MNPLYTDSDWKRRVSLAQKEGLPAEDYRKPWRRDYARVLHSPAFRRLQGKTQLFPGNESDFFRNRLTHSLEVAQIAKSIAIRLNHTSEFLRDNGFTIKYDICEMAGLAHDLGHPPFGHNGERALHDLMRSAGGFEGNAQTLRVISRIEKREKDTTDPTGIEGGLDRRAGLNLTYRSLAAILKSDREIPQDNSEGAPKKGYYSTEKDVVREAREHVLGSDDDVSLNTVECSIMDVADDIAYSTYDLELNLARDGYLRNDFTSYLVSWFLTKVRFGANEDKPALSRVFLPERERKIVEVLKKFSYVVFIRAPRLRAAERRGTEIVGGIFRELKRSVDEGVSLLPADFDQILAKSDEKDRDRVIADFVAGMTDRYALEFYGRLFSENPQTIFKPL